MRIVSMYVCRGGINSLMIFDTSDGEEPGSGVGKTSEGRRRHFPYTASAGDAPRAAWGVARRERSTHGNFVDQSPSIQDDAKAVFRVLWKRSIMPFASGL